MSKFEVKVATNGKHYFVLKAKNGATLVQSEMYQSKNACLKGIETVRKVAVDAVIVEG